MTDHEARTRVLIIRNVHLALGDRNQQLFTVRCKGSIIEKISPYSAVDDDNMDDCIVLDGNGGILIPSLCHSHIHLDKCNILPHCDSLVSGTFEEAMHVTSKAKASYQSSHLLSRGRALIRESVMYGVTAMRAHVEVDTIVGLMCVDAGIRLKEEFRHLCDIGIAVFAQDPLFTSEKDITTSQNLRLLREAAANPYISTIGSAPYVEPSPDLSRLNIDHILTLAINHSLHVDFHLDYNILLTTEPLTPYVIDRLRALDWTHRMPGKHVTIGHAPRLGLFSHDELHALHNSIQGLPVTLVGLPQTDVYMLGRPNSSSISDSGTLRPRGTLNVPRIVREYGLDVAMSVNNIGNAFTPQGSLDPLSLCTFGVAVFQAGTKEDCEVLLDSISNTSKRAAGYPHPASLLLRPDDPADMLLVHGPGNGDVQSLVLNPGCERTVMRRGRVVATRRVAEYVADS